MKAHGRIVDTDTHLIEAADVWTSRLPKKWADSTMRVQWNPERQREMWYIGDKPIKGAWENISHRCAADGARTQVDDERWAPSTLKEAHPSSYSAAARAKLMDEWGVDVAVLFPNAAGFALEPFLKHPDPEISLAHVRAYNDYQVEEWSSAVPGRFLPIMALPYWDLKASVAEIERLADAGFGGVVTTGAPQEHGLPHLVTNHWDPLWRACEEADLSVSFHVAGGNSAQDRKAGPSEKYEVMAWRLGTEGYLDNARHTTDLLCSGILARFPKIKFVITESGVGWVPFVLESLDHRFKKERIWELKPEFGDALPGDLFKRQVFVNFWFERLTDAHIESIGIDSILWETDYPHPTSLDYSDFSDVLGQAFGDQPESVRNQILWENPKRLYRRALEKQGVKFAEKSVA